MLKPQDNDRITRVGPGTPMGNLLRRYWQPALLAEELAEPDGPPVRVRLLGEDLIAFRDSSGAVGLVDAFCPHRRAPLFFGRNEECGLRCVYHGWKFDRSGACVDMPTESSSRACRGTLFKTSVRGTGKVSVTAYRTHESGGIVWTYMGPPETNFGPPDYEFCRVPATHRFAGKTHQECNWLQSLEGGIDSTHFSYLHVMDLDDRTSFSNRDRAPLIESERTAYWMSGATIHRLDDGTSYVRTNQYILPAWSIRSRVTSKSGAPEPVPQLNGHVWVPIDDENCWVYNWFYAYDPAVPIPERMWIDRERSNGRGPEDHAGGFKLKWIRDNEYGLDRAVQRSRTYTGIPGINLQDVALQEGMGPILDRSREHLAPFDRGVILMRQLLFEAMDAVERGETPRGADPATYRNVRAADFIVPDGADRAAIFGDAELARF
jgi:phthalate 4,5-dioxygenase oxygenase subunit